MKSSAVIIEPLITLAQTLGSDPGLVQGAGGNLSLKDGNTLWVKASGTWLSEAGRRRIFVPLALPGVLHALAQGKEDFLPFLQENTDLRPSIETSLHAILPARIVVHVHSINALSFAVCRNGKEEAARRLQGLDWSWIDYVRPGLPLARAIEDALRISPHSTVFLLANHGLIVMADTVEDVLSLLHEVERRLAPQDTDSVMREYKERMPQEGRLPKNAFVHHLACDACAKELISAGILYPDQAVFLGSHLPVIVAGNEDALHAALSTHPHCAIIENKGMVLGTNCSANTEATLECLALLLPRLPRKEELYFLNAGEIDELLHWDAEKWRQAMEMK